MKWKPQKTRFTCGPASFLNCLLTFGISSTEEKLREIMKTTKYGTDERGFIRAAKFYGLSHRQHYTRSPLVFKRKILKALNLGHPCILITENGQHWVSAVEYSKRKIKIIDPVEKKMEMFLTSNQIIKLAFNYEKLSKNSYYYFLELYQ